MLKSLELEDDNEIPGYHYPRPISYFNASDQNIVFNEECDCGGNPCTRKFPNRVIGMRGEIPTIKNVTGATYNPDTNDFTLNEGVNSFSYEFEQTIEHGSRPEHPHIFSGKVQVNLTHAAPEKYKATHSFVSRTEGTELPQEVRNLIPADQTDIVNGSEVTPTSPEKTEVTVSDGKWIFKGYTPAKATVNGADVSFEGGWTFVKSQVSSTSKKPAAVIKNTPTAPKTGDVNDLSLWILCGGTSLAGAVAGLAKRRKKRKTN